MQPPLNQNLWIRVVPLHEQLSKELNDKTTKLQNLLFWLVTSDLLLRFIKRRFCIIHSSICKLSQARVNSQQKVPQSSIIAFEPWSTKKLIQWKRSARILKSCKSSTRFRLCSRLVLVMKKTVLQLSSNFIFNGNVSSWCSDLFHIGLHPILTHFLYKVKCSHLRGKLFFINCQHTVIVALQPSRILRYPTLTFLLCYCS